MSQNLIAAGLAFGAVLFAVSAVVGSVIEDRNARARRVNERIRCVVEGRRIVTG